MEIYLNGIEITEDKLAYNEDMTLNEILQKLQEIASKEKETIVSVKIDDIEHNLDFFDDENDMDSEFIDKIEAFSEGIHSLSKNVLIDIESYLIRIYENLSGVIELYEKEDKIEAVNKTYDILEGLKYVNIAFNSLNNMELVNVKNDKIGDSSFVEVLAKLNNTFLEIVDMLKEKNYEKIIDILEYDATITLRETLDFFPFLMKQLEDKGE